VSEPTVRFPVTCPKCGAEQIEESPVAEVAAALLSDGKLRFLASCHTYTWNASPAELEQIREYLDAVRVKAGEPTLGTVSGPGRAREQLLRSIIFEALRAEPSAGQRR
jgi:hypothetical protein